MQLSLLPQKDSWVQETWASVVLLEGTFWEEQLPSEIETETEIEIEMTVRGLVG